MVPLLDNSDEDDVDGWREPTETLASGQTLLSKYDDVEELAMKKKRANRVSIGATARQELSSEN